MTYHCVREGGNALIYGFTMRLYISGVSLTMITRWLEYYERYPFGRHCLDKDCLQQSYLIPCVYAPRLRDR